MRIKNKYLRNQAFKEKAIRKAKTHCGNYIYYPISLGTQEDQERWYRRGLKVHDKWFNSTVRAFYDGAESGFFNAPKWFRRMIDNHKRSVIHQIEHECLFDIDAADKLPFFRKDANWNYW